MASAAEGRILGYRTTLAKNMAFIKDDEVFGEQTITTTTISGLRGRTGTGL